MTTVGTFSFHYNFGVGDGVNLVRSWLFFSLFYFILLQLPSRTKCIKFLSHYLIFRGETVFQESSSLTKPIPHWFGSSLHHVLECPSLCSFPSASNVGNTCYLMFISLVVVLEEKKKHFLSFCLLFSLRQTLHPWVTGMGLPQLSDLAPGCGSGPNLFAVSPQLVGF